MALNSHSVVPQNTRLSPSRWFLGNRKEPKKAAEAGALLTATRYWVLSNSETFLRSSGVTEQMAMSLNQGVVGDIEEDQSIPEPPGHCWKLGR